MEQGQLWPELPDEAVPRRRAGRGGPAAAVPRTEVTTLSLWEGGADAETRGQGDAETQAVPAAKEPPPARAAPKPVASGATRGRGGTRVGDADAEEAGMEAAAGWLEELFEGGGKAVAAVREFVAVFPPTSPWGEPWAEGVVQEDLPGFRPRAASYAQALREVAAGRRRARVGGRWIDGRDGTLVLGLLGAGDAVAWTVLGADGL